MQAKDPIVEELKYLKLQAALAEKQLGETLALKGSSRNGHDYDDLIASLEELQTMYLSKIRSILNGQF